MSSIQIPHTSFPLKHSIHDLHPALNHQFIAHQWPLNCSNINFKLNHSPPASNSLDLRVHNSSKRPILESARDRAPMEEFIFGFMRLGPTSFKFNSCEPHLSSQILIGSHEFCLSV